MVILKKTRVRLARQATFTAITTTDRFHGGGGRDGGIDISVEAEFCLGCAFSICGERVNADCGMVVDTASQSNMQSTHFANALVGSYFPTTCGVICQFAEVRTPISSCGSR